MRHASTLLLIACLGSAVPGCEDDSLYATGEPVPVMPGGGSMDGAAIDAPAETAPPADAPTAPDTGATDLARDVPRDVAVPPVDTGAADTPREVSAPLDGGATDVQRETAAPADAAPASD